MQLSSMNWEVHPNKRIANGRALLTPDMMVRFQTKNYCLKPTVEEIKEAYAVLWMNREIKTLVCSLADFVCTPL